MSHNLSRELPVNPEKVQSIPLWMAWLPILVLIGLLFYNVVLYEGDATSGPNQIALLLAASVAALLGMTLGVPFSQMLVGIKRSIDSSMTALLILLIIGSLIGTWVISGVVPAMIYYGLSLLKAEVFLAACVVVCAVVSVATGSSWSTVGTVGIALMGIGHALNVPPAYSAGAIISGAYFGDKISPLSDTTNLAAAMAGTELMTHVRYMLYTTVPSILITIGIFFYLGYSSMETPSVAQTQALQAELTKHFHISPWLFLVPGVVLTMVVLRIDPLVSLFVGTLLGGLFAVVLQPQVIMKLADDQASSAQVAAPDDPAAPTPRVGFASYCQSAYRVVINAMVDKDQVKIVSDEEVDAWAAERDRLKTEIARVQFKNPQLTLDELSSEQVASMILTSEVKDLETKIAAAGLIGGKGMKGMLNTVWLVICAMCFGGVMEACGLLQRIALSLLSFAKTTFSLITTTVGSCMFVNMTASDQYLAIVVPGRMFYQAYKDRGLAPQNLSRTLEDSGTVTSVLVPWNTCGAAQSTTLGIATLAYAPFCFFNWISPLMTILFGLLGLGIARLPKND